MNKILVKVAIGLLLIGIFGLPVYSSTIEEELQKLKAAGIPTTVEELNLPEIPDAENGALVYKEAFNLIYSLSEQYKEIFDYFPYEGRVVSKWEDVPEEKKQEVIELILHNPDFAKMYQLLEKASKMKCIFIKKEDYQNPSRQLTHLNQLRYCARILAAKAKIEKEQGEMDKALNTCLTTLRIGDSLSNEPTLISQLVRIAMDGIALNSLEEVISGEITEGKSNDSYQSLLKETQTERKTNITNFALKGELVCGNLPFFSRYKKLGEKVFELTEEEKKTEELQGADFVKQIKDEKQELKNIYLNSGCKTPEEFFEKQEISFLRTVLIVIPLTEKPYWQVNKELEKIDKDIKNLPDNEIFSKSTLPAIVRVYMLEARTDAQLGAAEIAIANKIYKTKHGEYVESLSQLSPEILPTTPLDPFTGKDYIYKKKEKGFIVYSLGENLKDDGGISQKQTGWKGDYDIVWECSF